MQELLTKRRHVSHFSRIDSVFYLWSKPYADIKGAREETYGQLFHALLEGGMAPAPNAYEVGRVDKTLHKQFLSILVERD